MDNQINIEGYKYLEELSGGEMVRVITIRNKKYRIKGLRAKAVRMISSMLINRDIPKEDAKPIEVMNAQSKYYMIPYRMLAVTLLNNNYLFLLFPFIHRIYAWWLSTKLTQDDVSMMVNYIVESLQLNGFFLTITTLEASLDLPLKMTKSQVGVLLANVQSAKKST